MDVMLRPWRPEDAPSIARHADDPQVAANLRDVFPCPYQLSDAEEFIRLCRAAEPEQAIFRAIVVDGQAVGSVALTRGEKGGACLTVRNTGPAIPPEHLEHLFERFYRADDSRARSSGGYGLGLAIAKSIVDSHRGTITVQSGAEEGTLFTVRLPG